MAILSATSSGKLGAPIIVGDTFDAFAFRRRAWTGGDVPPKRYHEPYFLALRRYFFREQVKQCGGLDLWACAGTSALERARIFWNSARLDAWRTVRP